MPMSSRILECHLRCFVEHQGVTTGQTVFVSHRTSPYSTCIASVQREKRETLGTLILLNLLSSTDLHSNLIFELHYSLMLNMPHCHLLQQCSIYMSAVTIGEKSLREVIDEVAMSIFQNFMERVVAASLTSTMDNKE